MIHHQVLATIVENDLNILKKYRAQWDALTQLEILLKRTIEEKKQLDMALFDEMWELEQQERAHQALLEKIQNEKFLHIAAVAALQRAQTDLNENLRTIEAFEKSQNKKANGPVHVPSPPFHEAKGTLDMPVTGKIITHFGRSENNDNRTFTFQSGIDISTLRGEPVKSIFRGTVVYSQWLKSYGNVIIIDHGNSYYTLYAHLDERFKQKGTRVNTGDVIATAGHGKQVPRHLMDRLGIDLGGRDLQLTAAGQRSAAFGGGGTANSGHFSRTTGPSARNA